jgi:drug/metabolite transporter (DMT)-like permease
MSVSAGSVYAGRHCAPRDRRLSVSYVVAAVFITASYPRLSDTQRMVGFLFVSLATVPFAVVGLRRTPPRTRGPWWPFLAALISLNVDNLTWYWYVYLQHQPTRPSPASWSSCRPASSAP